MGGGKYFSFIQHPGAIFYIVFALEVARIDAHRMSLAIHSVCSVLTEAAFPEKLFY